MTNFDFLLSSLDFAAFGEAAVAAEKIYAIDPAACVMTCRRGEKIKKVLNEDWL